MRILLLISTLLMWAPAVGQQKSVESVGQGWLAYMNHTRITNRSGVWVDIQYRRTGHVADRYMLSIFRGAYSFFATDHVSVQAGYAYIDFGHAVTSPNHEHRLWQQIQWILPGKIRTTQWLRAEQRLRHAFEHYDFNWRFRHNLALTMPISRSTGEAYTFAVVSNELHINAGKEIAVNYFDQNRLFVGIGHALNRNTNLQVGYLNVFQQRAAANQFIQAHGIRMVLVNTFDLRPKARG